MADQSTQSIVVDAPAAQVMAVIADFPAYPTWVSAAKQVEVVKKHLLKLEKRDDSSLL